VTAGPPEAGLFPGWPLLADPTLDQIAEGHPWLGAVARPLVAPVPDAWYREGSPGGRVELRSADGSWARYAGHPERQGWLGAQAYRVTARRPVVAAALAVCGRAPTSGRSESS
jgi:hypothetical protein